MNENILLIGIDCATKANKVGIAMGSLAEDGRVIVTDAWRGSAAKGGDWQAVVKQRVEAATNVLIALDAPLGWPRAMGAALAVHKAGASIDLPPSSHSKVSPDDQMFVRETDLMVRERIKKITKNKDGSRQEMRPLEVGANLIARTAYSALGFLASLEGVQLPCKPGPVSGKCAIEVYPAATLSAHGLPCEKYKRKDKDDHKDNREKVMNWVFGRVKVDQDAEETTRAIRDGDHVLDAVICLVAAADFVTETERMITPDPEQKALAEKEGWIWVVGSQDEENGTPSR